jgi:hypothetical protein
MAAKAALPAVPMMAQAVLAAVPAVTASLMAVAAMTAAGRTALGATAGRTALGMRAALVAVAAGMGDGGGDPATHDRHRGDHALNARTFGAETHGLPAPHHQ